MESLVDYGYDVVYKTNDLDCLNNDNIMTEYERKFYNLGVKINKLEAIKNLTLGTIDDKQIFEKYKDVKIKNVKFVNFSPKNKAPKGA